MVQQVLTGTQIPIDAATIADMAAKNNLTARGQDITARDAINQINEAYYRDAQTVGIQRAQLNYQQRLAQVQQALAAASQGYTERLGAANTKLTAMKALADRSGPQDWVRYNNLLNGLIGPRGTSTTIDPTAFANDLVDPQFRAGATNGPDLNTLLSNLNQPYDGSGAMANVPQLAVPAAAPSWSYVAPAPAPAATGAGAGTSATSPAPTGIAGAGSAAPAPITGNGSWSQPNVQPNAVADPVAAGINKNDPSQWYSGVPNAQVAGLTSGQRQFVTTGLAGPSKVGDYNGFNVFLNNQLDSNPADVIGPGTPIWVQKLSAGTKRGMIRDLMAIVGEGKGQKPGSTPAQKTLGNTGEVVVNPTGAPMGVLNNDQAKQMLNHYAMGSGMRGYRKGSGLQFGAPRAVRGSGGMRMAGMGPAVKPVSTKQQAPGLLPLTGTAAALVQQQQQAQQDQQAQQANTDPNQYSSVGYAFPPLGPAEIANLLTMNRMSKGSGMRAQDAEDIAETRAGHPPSAAEESEEDKRTKRAKVGFTILGRELRRFVNGTGVTASNPNGLGTPGSPNYGIDPTTQTYTQYSPADTGNQPFYRKLTGQIPNAQFQGFGATLSNPSLGITNAPWAINMQNYLRLNPSEQDQTQSLYQQGLGTDFRDQLAQGRASAPFGATMGVTRYGA